MLEGLGGGLSIVLGVRVTREGDGHCDSDEMVMVKVMRATKHRHWQHHHHHHHHLNATISIIDVTTPTHSSASALLNKKMTPGPTPKKLFPSSTQVKSGAKTVLKKSFKNGKSFSFVFMNCVSVLDADRT